MDVSNDVYAILLNLPVVLFEQLEIGPMGREHTAKGDFELIFQIQEKVVESTHLRIYKKNNSMYIQRKLNGNSPRYLSFWLFSSSSTLNIL